MNLRSAIATGVPAGQSDRPCLPELNQIVDIVKVPGEKWNNQWRAYSVEVTSACGDVLAPESDGTSSSCPVRLKGVNSPQLKHCLNRVASGILSAGESNEC